MLCEAWHVFMHADTEPRTHLISRTQASNPAEHITQILNLATPLSASQTFSNWTDVCGADSCLRRSHLSDSKSETQATVQIEICNADNCSSRGLRGAGNCPIRGLRGADSCSSRGLRCRPYRLEQLPAPQTPN